eukprot:3815040-Pyramimonas_sp.AAC.1
MYSRPKVGTRRDETQAHSRNHLASSSYVRTYEWMQIWMPVCMDGWMCVRMYVCMYACEHRYTNNDHAREPRDHFALLFERVDGDALASAAHLASVAYLAGVCFGV